MCRSDQVREEGGRRCAGWRPLCRRRPLLSVARRTAGAWPLDYNFAKRRLGRALDGGAGLASFLGGEGATGPPGEGRGHGLGIHRRAARRRGVCVLAKVIGGLDGLSTSPFAAPALDCCLLWSSAFSRGRIGVNPVPIGNDWVSRGGGRRVPGAVRGEWGVPSALSSRWIRGAAASFPIRPVPLCPGSRPYPPFAFSPREGAGPASPPARGRRRGR